MDIRHERALPDLEYRVQAPLVLTLANTKKQIEIREWSLAGIIYPEDINVLPQRGELTIPFQGIDLSFPVTFTQGSSKNELLFQDLTGRQRETLAVFYRSILSGKMASSETMITALDTPVDLIPMGETEEETSAGQKEKSPRILRIIWNVAFYFILAALLFILIGGQIWSKLTTVQITGGRVMAPVLALSAPEAAYVDRILVQEGDAVSQGQVLIRMSDPDRESDVEDIRKDLPYAKSRVREARALLEAHLAQKSVYRAPFEQNLDRALAQRSLRDLLGYYNMDGVLLALSNLEKFDQGQAPIDSDFHKITSKLKSDLNQAKDAESRLKRDLSNAKDAARALDVIAKADGFVAEIPVLQNEYVHRGQPLMTFEENTARQLRGWISEHRAKAIFVGMIAKVEITDVTGTRSIDAQIIDIFAGVDPATDKGFGAIVTLSLPDLQAQETRDILRPDAPVTIRALKPWATRWGTW